MSESGMIKSLLKQRHSRDVFVDECKDGPTLNGGHRRIDGWAMKRSWSNPCVFGYEIKVSRSDFLQDQKWHDYLSMCNQLYFVCPWGLIKPAEIPGDVGLLWVTKTGTRLYSKAKAAHRDIDIPESLWRYLLMCRSEITRETRVTTDKEFWDTWLAQKRVDHDFGRRVSKSIAQRIREEIIDTRNENKELKSLMRQYDGVRKTLTSLGIDPDNKFECSSWGIERKLKEARTAIPDNLIRSLEQLSRQAIEASARLKEIEGITSVETEIK